MNYKDLYDKLYTVGYHAKGKNHGLNYIKGLLAFDWERILEVGCANGLVVRKLNKAGKMAYGIDVSELAIRYANERIGARNCIEADVLDIPFKNKFFDAVFSCDVLEHLEENDIDTAIKEITRVTKKWVMLKLSPEAEGNREWITRLKKSYRQYKDLENLHLSIFSLAEWIQKIESTGLLRYVKTKNDLMAFYVK